jgi:hypothetical protein
VLTGWILFISRRRLGNGILWGTGMRKVQVRISSNLHDAMDDLRRWLDHRRARLEDFSIKIERDGTAVVSVAFRPWPGRCL